MDARPRILVVDDEARSVELLVRSLRRIARVESATTGDEAWAKAQAEPPDLVITDQRMPGLKGTELLAKIAERDRYVGRIILTGYADLQATIDAINQGGIHAYVNKPWAPDQLVLTVQGILERMRLERSNAELVSELTTANRGLEVAMSELRAAQTRVLDAERLGAIGQMAAMIVHDFRGPLTVIRSSAGELARTGTELPAEEVVELGASALEEAERMTRMCAELLEVTRASEGDANRQEEPLDDFLESVLAVVAEEAARAAVNVESRLGAGVSIGLDSDRMRRALLNLVYNAIEAMPEGGVLRVVSERQGDSVLVRISDSGVGVPEELIDRVFEPFVTAGKSGGSGLGLAVVKKVVDDHGGSIEARKAEGGGACFQISLPLSPTR